MKDIVDEPPEPDSSACWQIFIAAGFKGPVDDQRLAQQVISGNETPEAAVLAAIPIVAHHKILTRRDAIRSKVCVDAARIDIPENNFPLLDSR